LESQIESTFKIKECRIIPSFSANNEIYKYAGIELVDLLKRLLKKDMYVGVTWSQALKNTIEYINPGKRIIINVVPMIGGLELNGMTTNSNIIAHIFAEKMGGINYTVSIPAVFDSKKAKEIIEKERHTKKIKEIADKIELAITGVGDMGFDGTAFKSGYFTHDERSYLESLGIVAIVNLNFINAKGEEVKTEIDDRIIKIFPLEKFKSLNDVIGIAFGENKVIPLKAALSGKIIKYLITDENTANKLLG
jgi:deoxyribonucleoside regulator